MLDEIVSQKLNKVNSLGLIVGIWVIKYITVRNSFSLKLIQHYQKGF